MKETRHIFGKSVFLSSELLSKSRRSRKMIVNNVNNIIIDVFIPNVSQVAVSLPMYVVHVNNTKELIW